MEPVKCLDHTVVLGYLQCRYIEGGAIMKTRVQKWGNSLALRIPKSFAEEVGLLSDSPVEISLTNGKLVVVPIEKPGLSLKKLLSRITDENIHHEIDSGPAVGIEAW
jgi:antitoxin MazE